MKSLEWPKAVKQVGRSKSNGSLQAMEAGTLEAAEVLDASAFQADGSIPYSRMHHLGSSAVENHTASEEQRQQRGNRREHFISFRQRGN